MENKKKEPTAYHAALDAYRAWSLELAKVYGKQAGDARYDARGTATERLAELAGDFEMKSEALRDCFSYARGAGRSFYEYLPLERGGEGGQT